MHHLLIILFCLIHLALGPRVLADPASARTSAIITQAAVTAGTLPSIDRSQLNRYDALNRLIAADVGVVEINTDGVTAMDVLGRARADVRRLDLLGNWTGGAAAGTTGPPVIAGAPGILPGDFGRLTVSGLGSGQGGPTWDARTDTVDAQNQIDFIKDVQYGGPATGTDRATRYDPAGT